MYHPHGVGRNSAQYLVVVCSVVSSHSSQRKSSASASERAPASPPSSDPWQTTRPPAAPRRQVRRCLACTSRCKACGRTGGTVIRHSSRKHSRICFTVAPRPAKRRKPGSNRSLPAPQALFEHTRQPPRRTQRIERSPPCGPSSSVPAAQSRTSRASLAGVSRPESCSAVPSTFALSAAPAQPPHGSATSRTVRRRGGSCCRDSPAVGVTTSFPRRDPKGKGAESEPQHGAELERGRDAHRP